MSILADIGAFTNPFGTPSAGKWNLQKGIFKNVNGDEIIFFYEQKDPNPTVQTAIDQTTDGTGRRIAAYEYPYKDGQALADLGRKPFNFNFNIKFFGENYQSKLKDFYDKVVNVKGMGTLTHPTLSPIFGAFPVRLMAWEPVHRHDEWNAATIKVTFAEDNTSTLQTQDLPPTSPDSAMRTALQTLVSTQAAISGFISDVSAVLLIPSQVQAALNQRLSSIVGQVSRLLGQLGVTFSSDQSLKALSQMALSTGGSVTNLTSGTVQNSGSGTVSQLPPVFQVGLDPASQPTVEAQLDSFANANQITSTQAVFSANQARASITDAIAEIEARMGTYGYDIILEYRELSVTVQDMVEASISTSQSKVKTYVVPQNMSLRLVAQAVGLAPDRQNDIADLNPDIDSINFVPRGTSVLVPAS